MTATVVRGDARALPLPDQSVDLVVTSPPYFALRSYQDGGEHYAGQVGSEPTPAEFLDALIACTAEMMRVVKPSGSIWVNLGDKYSTGNGGDQRLTQLGQRLGTGGGQKQDSANRASPRVKGFPPKTLLGLPWRYALRCIDELGLILRAEVIWSKPNGLPESVTDRVRRSHEQWFHFTVRPRYYAAVDTIREPQAEKSFTHRGGGESWGNERNPDNNWGDPKVRRPDPLGKLPGSVWSIPSQPLTIPEWVGVDHFAAFPMEWPRRIIQGWSPSGICGGCGEGRRPVSAISYEHINVTTNAKTNSGADIHHGIRKQAPGFVGRSQVSITGEVCACPDLTAPTRPAVILDPFGGTGTVALLADVLGRHGVSVDMSADYCRAARWRTSDPGERARAMQVEKPEPVPVGQLGLFEG